MYGPKYTTYLNCKKFREAAEQWLCHIGQHGRGSDVLALSPLHASIKLTVCGQYTEGGKNYWENPSEFGAAMLAVIHTEFSSIAEKAISLMREQEKQALASAASEISAVNAELASALGRPDRGPIHLVFDAFPSPEGSRFIEAEDEAGKSIKAGEWVSRPDGLVALVIPA